MSPPIDRISSLPDELLCLILSSLPTKHAYSTLILSKRWAPLRLSKLLTSLHFDDEYVSDKKTFHGFRSLVNKVTRSTELIKSFHLRCNSKLWHDSRFEVYINNWIKTLKKHRVENLHISTTEEISLSIFLPQSIFISPTLVSLKLERVKVFGDISVDLPSLKTLHVDQLYLKNSQNFIKLLNGCPILEDLMTEICYMDGVGGPSVSTKGFKTLSKLIRADIYECDVPITTISNVEYLTVTMEGLYSEPETNLYLRGLLVCHNLIRLELRFYCFHHLDNVVEVLQNCPKLQFFSIKKWVVFQDNQVDLSRNWKEPNYVPECISSHLRSCILDYNGMEDELRFASYILQNALVLEVMKIIAANSNPLKNRDALEELTFCPRISPHCKFSIC